MTGFDREITATREKLPERGRYTTTVRDIKGPSELRSVPAFAIDVEVELDGKVVDIKLAGYLPICQMILASKDYWIGRTITVDVAHKMHDNERYASFRIIF